VISLKGTIIDALNNDAAIKTLLKGQHVYPLGTAPATQYPRIVVWEVVNIDADSADDTVYSSRMIYQVDVFAKSNPEPIAREVDRVMKQIGFSRNGGADDYDEDAKVFFKALRYAILVEEVTGNPPQESQESQEP